MFGTVYGDTHLKDLNYKSRVLHPGPGILSSATWTSLQKKPYNGLINQSDYFETTYFLKNSKKQSNISDLFFIIV